MRLDTCLGEMLSMKKRPMTKQRRSFFSEFKRSATVLVRDQRYGHMGTY